jgi:hypothetical protein
MRIMHHPFRKVVASSLLFLVALFSPAQLLSVDINGTAWVHVTAPEFTTWRVAGDLIGARRTTDTEGSDASFCFDHVKLGPPLP